MTNYYIEKEYTVKLGCYIEAKDDYSAYQTAKTRIYDLDKKLHNALNHIPYLTKKESISEDNNFVIKEVENDN